MTMCCTICGGTRHTTADHENEKEMFAMIEKALNDGDRELAFNLFRMSRVR